MPYANPEDRLARQRERRATPKGRTQLRAYRLNAKRKRSRAAGSVTRWAAAEAIARAGLARSAADIDL